ncbi:hypothetical protein [Nocardia coubleae]|nr:hypothetical protein [Nocardia coubleae]
MTEPSVTVERDGPVTTISINRPRASAASHSGRLGSATSIDEPP